MGFGNLVFAAAAKAGWEWRRPARAALTRRRFTYRAQRMITAADENALTASPTGTETVIASPVPFMSLAREMISGGNGLYTIECEDTTLPGVPLDRCDLTRRARATAQVDAFLFWARTPLIEPQEDGSLAAA